MLQHTQPEVERVDKSLHRRLAYAAHVEASQPDSFGAHDFEFFGEATFLLHLGLAGIFVGDVGECQHDDYGKDEPVALEKVAVEELSAQQYSCEGSLRLCARIFLFCVLCHRCCRVKV